VIGRHPTHAAPVKTFGVTAANTQARTVITHKPAVIESFTRPGVVWSADLGEASEIDSLVERYRTVVQGGRDLVVDELPLGTDPALRAEVVETSLHIEERSLGLDHPKVAATLNNQGSLFRRTKARVSKRRSLDWMSGLR
jgi:hypothetical protein